MNEPTIKAHIAAYEETYRVSVCNSRAGESAAKWTADKLREVSSEMRDIGGYL